MDNNSDSSTSVTDEEEEENLVIPETKSSESTPKRSPKQSTDSTDEPIMDEQQLIGVSKHQFEDDKKAVYKHPLFPLLALLLEKCESATSTLNAQNITSTTASFNSEIAAFIQHQQRDGKPFLSDDPEVDALMIKAIQVLRIHLLELEKVSELCKDFCNRYITCLRTKMSSENLLRGTSCVGTNSGSHSSANSFDGSSCSSDAESDDFSLTSPSKSYVSNSTPQTVYHMVQTAQGLVAQPIQLSSSQSGIGGSNPTSQNAANNLNTNKTNNSNNKSNHINSRADSSNDDEFSDDLGSNHSGTKKKQQKRGVLPKQATSIMRSWLFQHIVHPYPTEDEKRAIASQTNLTLLQVNNWFINARRRILQPMLDTANSMNESQGLQSQSTSKSSAKSCSAKKLKTSNSVQRFWPQSIANAIQGLSKDETK